MKTYEAIYNPDGELIALFADDSDQIVSTQTEAADRYFAENCSEFCTRMTFVRASLRDIPETL